jgi:hypothetical protein
MTTWPVFGNSQNKDEGIFEEYKSFTEVPQEIRFIKESMFPSPGGDPEIAKTVRILPHD